jgi:hypothetical protein
MDELLRLANQLLSTIERFRPQLRASEMLTRYTLIDPWLRALGWNTEDPTQVHPEFRTEGGWADYGLFTLAVNGNSPSLPAIVLEAKRLGTGLREHLNQAIAYCVGRAIPYFVVTDGERWELYDTFRRVPNEEKLVTSFSLAASDLPREVLKALCLWRPNTSSIIELAQRPVVGFGSLESISGDSQESDGLADQRGKVGQPLSQVHPKLGDAPPGGLILPDGRHQRVGSWRDLILGVIGYWQKENILTLQRCPMQSPRQRGRVIINTEAKHPNGESFRALKQVGPLWVETHANSRRLVANLWIVAQQLGVGLDGFSVRD